MSWSQRNRWRNKIKMARISLNWKLISGFKILRNILEIWAILILCFPIQCFYQRLNNQLKPKLWGKYVILKIVRHILIWKTSREHLTILNLEKMKGKKKQPKITKNSILTLKKGMIPARLFWSRLRRRSWGTDWKSMRDPIDRNSQTLTSAYSMKMAVLNLFHTWMSFSTLPKKIFRIFG